MRPDDAGIVARLDGAGSLDRDDPRSTVEAEQPRIVAELVDEPHFLARALDLDRPVVHELPPTLARRKPQALQAVPDRGVVAVFGAVRDLQLH